MSRDELPLALVPGQLMTPAVWEPVLPHIGPRQIIMADIMSDDSIAAMAGRLLNDAPDKFDLAGYAMGGFVAFEVMRVAPQRVGRLTLISTLAEADNDAQRARRQGYADLVAAGRFAEIADERVPILLSAEHASSLGNIVHDMATETGSARFLSQQSAILSRTDSRPSLPDIHCPTLIVHGCRDAIANDRHQDDLRRGIPHADFVEFDCGHLVTLEKPRELGMLLSNEPTRQNTGQALTKRSIASQ